jgi:hypothetical protein
MQNDRNSTRAPDPQAPQGRTLPAQGPRQQPVPRMPHERDESSDSQAGAEPSGQRMGTIAHDDLERGLVDTDKGPVLDQTYDKVREGTPDPAKKKLNP